MASTVKKLPNFSKLAMK